MAWVRSRVRAYRPHDEFVAVRRPLEDIGVVSVEAALQLDRAGAPGWKLYGVVVTVRFASGFPAVDIATILKPVEHAGDEIALLPHRGGELTPDAFDRATEQAAIVELLLIETVGTKRMGLCLQDLGELEDALAKLVIRGARDDAHATRRRLQRMAAMSGSKMLRAK